MNIVKIISAVSKLSGSKISTTLNKGALEMLAKKYPSKVREMLPDKFLKEPYIDYAVKASKRGYTIGAVRIRDGKEVIASGAVSVSNLGTPKSVIKYRLNFGENGNAIRANAFMDNSRKYKLADAEFNIGRKKGVITVDEKIGKAAGGQVRVDEQAYAQYLDKLSGDGIGSELCKEAKDVVNVFGTDCQNLYKKLLAGQDFSAELGKMKGYYGKLNRFIHWLANR